jgi:hypothetical protein
LEEVQAKDSTVLAKISDIKLKRQEIGQSEETEARQAAKRQKRLDRRDKVLTLPAPVGRMTTLRERRALRLNVE